MRIKGYNVFYAYLHQLLKRKRTVQRFTAGALVLASLVKHGHNNGNSACFALNCGNYSFKILIMIIRAHGRFLAVHFIGAAMIKYIGYDKQIVSAY